MLRAVIIWSTLFACGSYAAVPLEKFFVFGPQYGDQQLNQTSKESGRVALDPPFKIFEKLQDYVTVNYEGYIEFMSGLMAVYYGQVNLRTKGTVYWRKSTSKATLDKAREEVSTAFPAYQHIDLKWALVATWYQVVPHGSYDAPNTFQGILTTDGNNSFVIFYYNDISWYTQRTPSDSFAGFLLFENKRTILKQHFIEGSNSSDILTIEHRSNVGSSGKWILRIDQPIIYEPNSLCALPPRQKMASARLKSSLQARWPTVLAKLAQILKCLQNSHLTNPH
ncbi:nidogen-like domain-containing protein [Ditylenchus destructor]|nr:nidogen-like domain-containing protein [Ditylenchus destructor]